ncbi:MAG: hypothetical protein ABI673_05490 [Novosphingobium sp.]
MSLSEIETHAIAYYTATAANDLSIAGRWYPHGEPILVIGAGPIIIGQACEFDYSGTQAIKAPKG